MPLSLHFHELEIADTLFGELLHHSLLNELIHDRRSALSRGKVGKLYNVLTLLKLIQLHEVENHFHVLLHFKLSLGGLGTCA